METVAIDKYNYFQFNKKLNLPVYVRFKSTDFDPDIVGFLRSMRFDELTEKEGEDIVEKIADKDDGIKLLTISEASILVSRQIASARDSDRFGPESIVQKPGYNVYRYKNVAMVVYSLASTEWQMGCFPDFGHVDIELQCRIVMNRFLSWALAPLGFVGFWGTPVDEGIVVQRAIDTRGEAVFFNVRDRKIVTMDGEKRMRYSFSFIKLDPTISNRSLEMRFETLLSYLSVNTTYFGAQGLPISVRQLVQTLSRYSQGQLYPKENFQPRQEARLTGE